MPLLSVVAEPGTQQRPRFEAVVDRVRVDVIVTDAEGHFVENLAADDFTVFEDGVRQEIVAVQRVDLATSRLIDVVDGTVTELKANLAGRTATGGTERGVAAAETRRPPAPAEAKRRPAADMTPDRAADVADFGAIVFLIEFPGLDLKTKLRFTEVWRQILVETESLGLPQAIYLVDQVGRLREIVPLTRNPERFAEAVREVQNEPLVISRELGQESFGVGPAGNTGFARRNWAIGMLEILRQFCDSLAARPGRTALVWISSGVQLMDNAGFSHEWSAWPIVRQRQEKLYRAANSANVSIYGVDPSRMADLIPGADVAYGPLEPGATTSPLQGLSRVGSTRDMMGDSLRQAASATGGRAYIAWAEFGEVLQEIEDDTSSYYLLTYAAPEPAGDGEYHEIRVEVRRPGVEVRARRGYTDYPADERRSRFVSAVLSVPGTVSDLPVAAQAFRSWLPDGGANILMATAVDASLLGTHPDEDGNLEVSLEIHAALLDDDGELVAEHHDFIRARARVSGATQSTLDAPRSARDFLTHQHEWRVKPGTYDGRVMIWDKVTGRVGATQLDIEIPRHKPTEWRTSDLMLVEVDAAGTTRPIVDGVVPFARRVAAYVEVHNGRAPVVSGHISTVVSGERDPAEPQVAATDLSPGADLFAQRLRLSEGSHRGTLALPPLPPGDYLLKIRVEDSGAGKEKVLTVVIHVLEPASAA